MCSRNKGTTVNAAGNVRNRLYIIWEKTEENAKLPFLLLLFLQFPPLPVSTLEGRPRQRGKEKIEEPENTVSPLPISQMKIEDLSAFPHYGFPFFPSRCRGWVIWECDCCKFKRNVASPPPCFEFCTRRPVVPPKQKAIQTTQKRVERAHPCLQKKETKRKEIFFGKQTLFGLKTGHNPARLVQESARSHSHSLAKKEREKR